MYKNIQGAIVVFLVRYIDDILLLENNVNVFSGIESYLKEQFDMNDMGETNYIIEIKLLWNWKNKMLALSQSS